MNHLVAMRDRRVRGCGLAGFVALLAAAALLVAAPAVDAQSPPYATCAAYTTTLNGGGQTAADAAERLRSLGSPNPPGVERALDVAVGAESEATPDDGRPSRDAIVQATVALEDYFGPICNGLDVCPLIAQAVATDDASSAGAARSARELVAPSPPGISIALSVMAGEVTVAESQIHDSLAEAQEQVSAWFMCGPDPTDAPQTDTPPTKVAPSEPSAAVSTCGDRSVPGRPSCPRLAFTGPGSATALASVGVTLLGTGAVLVITRRRVEQRCDTPSATPPGRGSL